jgi:transcriptional regulator with XRE-family HTH domain
MNITIGKKIYELRKSKDITQEKLASEMGVSIAAVSKWET